MYRIAIKTPSKGLRLGIKSLPLDEARRVKRILGPKCIIVTEGYFYGKEEFREVF